MMLSETHTSHLALEHSITIGSGIDNIVPISIIKRVKIFC